MPSNSKTQNKKQASKKEVTDTTQVAQTVSQPKPVVEQAVVATSVEQPVQAAPSEPAQQGGAKRGTRAGSGTQSATQSATPAKKVAKGASTPAKSATPAKAKSTATVKAIGRASKAPAKATGKATSKKAPKTPKADADSEDAGDGKRSFKALLPGSAEFEGRYTGLTPYQAANKALSKYYREAGDKASTEITFSIRESTRGSKRTVYTYNGRRERLATPVEYTIKGKDGERTVTKAFKNRLTKVKKADAHVAPDASA
jgi:hypothetical protein